MLSFKKPSRKVQRLGQWTIKLKEQSSSWYIQDFYGLLTVKKKHKQFLLLCVQEHQIRLGVKKDSTVNSVS